MNRTNSVHTDTIDVDQGIETVNIATQTDRVSKNISAIDHEKPNEPQTSSFITTKENTFRFDSQQSQQSS